MRKGLHSYFSFHGSLFAADNLVMDLVLELAVPVQNVLPRLEPIPVRLVLIHFYARCLSNNESICNGVQNSVGQRYDAILGLNEVTGDFFELAEPGGEDFGIGEGCAKQNKLNALRNIHEGLFPDLSASPVIDVVALVKDDRLDPCDGQGGSKTEAFRLGTLLQQQVQEDFCGHDDDLGIGLKADISCHESHSGIGKLLGEIGELLIRQGLNGGRVEDATAAL